jgi:hypothetical protein
VPLRNAFTTRKPLYSGLFIPPNGTTAESNRIADKNWTSHMGEEKYVYLSKIFLSSAYRTGI